MFRGSRSVIGGACAVVAGAVVVGGVGCWERENAKPATSVAPVQADTRTVEEMLLEAGRDHLGWARVGTQINWATTLCRASIPGEIIDIDGPRHSASKDEATHGHKLYWLRAKVHGAYQVPFGNQQSAEELAAPVGQVLVKQSWSAKRVEVSWVQEGENRSRCSERNGQWFAADEPRELFIMMKMDKARADTDDGWLYGVVSADGSKVVRSGMLEDCMGCHREAVHDRQLGLDHRVE
jgi:hypothetical protein